MVSSSAIRLATGSPGCLEWQAKSSSSLLCCHRPDHSSGDDKDMRLFNAAHRDLSQTNWDRQDPPQRLGQDVQQVDHSPFSRSFCRLDFSWTVLTSSLTPRR